MKRIFRLGSAALLVTALAGVMPAANADSVESKLVQITKAKKLPVCIYPLYYAISFRDTKTNTLSGMDIEMAKELGKSLGAEVEFVESGFGTFIADLQSNKCAIGMFALGVTAQRAQAVEFSKPYMLASIYGVSRQGGKIHGWADLDEPGIKVAVMMGSYIETFMKGYLKNRQASDEAFFGGWFHSGDLAVWHEDGYVEIKDRSKDVIISGGENISTIEVEDCLYRHPAILEAAVVAKADEHWGEVPCAFVTLKEGEALDEEAIIRFTRDNMAHFKCPKQVIFAPLPKTSTGKVQKFALRALLKEQH